jgi:dTDP-4-dehydrorhamnose 3,5-epimerase
MGNPDRSRGTPGVDLSSDAESKYRLQDYGGRRLIDGVSILDLQRFNDDGGSMIELMRLSDAVARGLDGFRPAQVNYSTLQAGVVKAFHVHRRQTDVWFVPPEDRMLLVLVDVRRDSPSAGVVMRVVLGDAHARLVTIPPGVAHGCRNLAAAPGRIVYFSDVQFSTQPAECDEGRLPWDLVGARVWDVAWE